MEFEVFLLLGDCLFRLVHYNAKVGLVRWIRVIRIPGWGSTCSSKFMGLLNFCELQPNFR